MRDLEINGLTGEEETRRQYEYIEKARQYVAQKEKEAGRKLTCCVHTFGCQMNARDSEKLLGILTDIGYVETEDEHADFVIYNTCTVRENANNKVYGRLGYLSNFKKKNPHMMIALCGCMMQEPTVVEKILHFTGDPMENQHGVSFYAKCSHFRTRKCIEFRE